MDRLTPDLRESVINEIYKNVIDKFSFINLGQFTHSTKVKTIQIIEESYFSQGQWIFEKGEEQNPYIYILMTG